MTTTHKEEPGLVEALTKLIPAFEAVKNGWEAERRSRRNERRIVIGGLLIISSLLVVLIVAVFFFHQTTSKTLQTNRLIRECVDPPTHPSPPGTPFNKLSCYEQGQIRQGQAIQTLITGTRTLDQKVIDAQRTLDQAILNDLVPRNKIVLPHITLGSTAGLSNIPPPSAQMVSEESPAPMPGSTTTTETTTTTTMPVTTTSTSTTSTTTTTTTCITAPVIQICVRRFSAQNESPQIYFPQTSSVHVLATPYDCKTVDWPHEAGWCKAPNQRFATVQSYTGRTSG